MAETILLSSTLLIKTSGRHQRFHGSSSPFSGIDGDEPRNFLWRA